MADPNLADFRTEPAGGGKRSYLYLAVLLFAGSVYLGCIVSPPSLMDDVDAVQAQIARNMVASGDWVTARLDGVESAKRSGDLVLGLQPRRAEASSSGYETLPHVHLPPGSTRDCPSLV